MFPEGVFDHQWRNLHSAPRDHKFGASDNPKIAFFIKSCQVTRADPEVRESAERAQCIIPITEHRVRSTDQDFTHRPDGYLATQVVRNSHFACVHDASDRARPDLTVRRRDRVEADFGHATELEDRFPEHFPRDVMQLREGPVASADPVTKGFMGGFERIWMYTADEYDPNSHVWWKLTEEQEVMRIVTDMYTRWRKEDAFHLPKWTE